MPPRSDESGEDAADQAAGSALYKQVRALHRGLDLLRALNRGGASGIAPLSRATGIHRTTAHRILETLRELGYVARGDSDNLWRLTPKVRELSEGFTDEAWISRIATPIMGELMHEVVWPTDLFTLQEDHMVIRESTHRFSPFSIHRTMIGTRWPVLRTASGRAYLAFCSAAERRSLIDILRASPDPGNALARSPARLQAEIQLARRAGYGASVGEVDPKMSSISVPILLNGRVFGCISLAFFSRAMKPAEAAERYRDALHRATARIAAACIEAGLGG
ncbi:MAG: DNA-binding transcriptional regulator [Burkholderiaceae bacterium]